MREHYLDYTTLASFHARDCEASSVPADCSIWSHRSLEFSGPTANDSHKSKIALLLGFWEGRRSISGRVLQLQTFVAP